MLNWVCPTIRPNSGTNFPKRPDSFKSPSAWAGSFLDVATSKKLATHFGSSRIIRPLAAMLLTRASADGSISRARSSAILKISIKAESSSAPCSGWAKLMRPCSSRKRGSSSCLAFCGLAKKREMPRGSAFCRSSSSRADRMRVKEPTCLVTRK